MSMVFAFIAVEEEEGSGWVWQNRWHGAAAVHRLLR